MAGIFYPKSGRPNRWGLPEFMIRALEYSDSYDDKDTFLNPVGVTTIIDSPKIKVLSKIHKKEISAATDIVDDHYFVMGSMAHQFIERAVTSWEADMPNALRYIPEQRLAKLFEGNPLGRPYTLLGIADLIEITGECEPNNDGYTHTGILWDFKTKKANGFSGGITQSEEKQVNIYRYLIESQTFLVNDNGVQKEIKVRIESAWIMSIIKDWSAMGHVQDPRGYPPFPFPFFQVKLWAPSATHNYILTRLAMYEAVSDAPQEYLCSAEEQWRGQDDWAIYTNQASVRAYRKFTGDDAEAEAKAMLVDVVKKHPAAYVTNRPSVPRRCMSFCPVKQFCKQAGAELGTHIIKEVTTPSLQIELGTGGGIDTPSTSVPQLSFNDFDDAPAPVVAVDLFSTDSKQTVITVDEQSTLIEVDATDIDFGSDTDTVEIPTVNPINNDNKDIFDDFEISL